MLQEEGDVWPCAEGACSMARACVDDVCVPCAAHAECLEAELCVLGACVLTDQADCQSRADCSEEDAFCILSGFTAMDPRGNRDMHATCLLPVGGKEPTPEETEAAIAALQAQAKPNPSAAGSAPEDRALELLRHARENEAK